VGDQLTVSVAVGPGTAVVGVTLVASACLAALWRRRLRLVLVIALLMLALYSGPIGDLLRLSSGLLGLALGALLYGGIHERLRRSEVPVVSWPSRAERRVLVALVVAASALGPLIAAWAQSRVGPLSVLRFVFAAPPPNAGTVRQICAAALDPRDLRECAELQARLRFSEVGPALLSVMPVVLLLIAAEGLRRGRRAAWGLAVGLNLGLAALALVLMTTHAQQRIVLGAVVLDAGVHARAWISILLPLVQPLLVVVLLVTTRTGFDVRAPRGTYRALLRAVVAALVLAAAAYVSLGLMLRDDFDPVPGVVDLLGALPSRLVPPGYLVGVAPGFLPVGWAATMLYEWIGPAVWLVLAVAALRTFLRSRPGSAESDLVRVRALLGAGAGGSLQYMATWPGHAYWFRHRGRRVPGDRRGGRGHGRPGRTSGVGARRRRRVRRPLPRAGLDPLLLQRRRRGGGRHARAGLEHGAGGRGDPAAPGGPDLGPVPPGRAPRGANDPAGRSGLQSRRRVGRCAEKAWVSHGCTPSRRRRAPHRRCRTRRRG
jgi:lysylphosphatidylglycerol synthetase-like protein (DUF2156 family)